MENYSLSDIAAVNGGGLGGSNSWILIILFAMIFGNGGLFGNRTGEFGNYATAASQQEILFGQHFQNLDNKMDRLGNGLSDLGYALNNSIADVKYNMATMIAGVNSNIDNKFAAIEKAQLEQTIAAQKDRIDQLQLNQAMCGIPRVNNTAWGVYPYGTACGCQQNI